MIEIKNISKNFGKLKALENVNLRFNKAECIALIGPNGCGKTTLIKTILGMVLPDSGDVFFNGQSIKNDTAYRKQLGYMPQIGRYPDNMTIGQVTEMIKGIRTQKEPQDKELADAFNLDKLSHKKMRTLSGGTTQKVSATLAFMFKPQVLILDEPTAGLDPIAAEILKAKIIAAKNDGCLILITSHLLSELEDIVSEIIFMQDGNVRFHKKVAELKADTGRETIAQSILHLLKSGTA
ncbi:MAG TPA: ABC transporter ATP-binding protein [Ferruginibacter sp.]|nr:ABC transporter ATP-binding protein [Ferruginibacter sp.]HRE62507.1 ABC transporter ATP-binding protein [Ferruginibacter sp.]